MSSASSPSADSVNLESVQLTAAHTSTITQYVTFGLGDYLFALPSTAILKVVATPPPDQGGLVSMGLVQLGPYSIQIVDLAKLFPGKKANDMSSERHSVPMPEGKAIAQAASQHTRPDQNPPFLIVLQSPDRILWGIPVYAPPDLIDIPDYALHAVPADKSSVHSLRWVSHIVNYSLGEKKHTLLVLNLSALWKVKSSQERADEAKVTAIQNNRKLARKSEMYV